MFRQLRDASKNPGVAKFGIALEWGSRGRWFESSHSDQKDRSNISYSGLFNLCEQITSGLLYFNPPLIKAARGIHRRFLYAVKLKEYQI